MLKQIVLPFRVLELLIPDRIPGSGEPGSDQNIAGTVNNNIPMDNMFTTSRDEDKKFEVFPEASMKSGPVYKAAEKYEM